MDIADPTAEAANFIEHSILVASGSAQANDGEEIEFALQRVADAFWPDLHSQPFVQFNTETIGLEIETPNALYCVSVRAVAR